MKKVSFKLLMMLLGVMAFSVAFTACDDDDDVSKASVVGKWTLEKFEVNGVVDEEEEEGECKEKQDYVEFLANGIFKDVYYNQDCKAETEEDKWKYEGDKLVLLFVESNGVVTYTYKGVYIVKTLTENSLVLEYYKSYKNDKEIMIDDDDDGKADKVVIYFRRLKS